MLRAPGEDQLGQAEVFGGHAELLAINQVPRHAAGFRTDGAIELAGAEAMKEAAVHGAEAKHADGARIAVGKDRLGAVRSAIACSRVAIASSASSQEMRSNASCSRPRSRAPLATPGFRRERIENAIGRVDAVEIFGNFAAKKALRDRMGGIALQLDGAARSRPPSPARRSESGQSCEQTVCTMRKGERCRRPWRHCKLKPNCRRAEICDETEVLFGFACGRFSVARALPVARRRPQRTKRRFVPRCGPRSTLESRAIFRRSCSPMRTRRTRRSSG